MRIIAGRHRRRHLHGPKASSPIRPTTDRGREMCFNILAHSSHGLPHYLEGAQVLDAFAGTGLWGLEALSRGAAHVTFWDILPEALRLLHTNTSLLKEENLCSIRQVDATRPPLASQAMDLVFLDPPYQKPVVLPALRALHQQGWLKLGTMVIIEQAADTALVLPSFLQTWNQRTVSATQFYFTRVVSNN